MKLKSNKTEKGNSGYEKSYSKKDSPLIKAAPKTGAPNSNPNRKAERLERAKTFAKKYSTGSGDKKSGRDDSFSKRGSKGKFGRNAYKDDGPTKKERDLMNKLNKKRTFQSNRFESKKSLPENVERKPKAVDTERAYTKRLSKGPALKNAQTKKQFQKNDHGVKANVKPTAIPDDGTRLNKYLANSGVAARRKCDEIIAQGFVKVNGKVILEMGYKVMPGDKVTYREKLVKPTNYVYILLNKPKDYLTTVEDDRGRHTVMELIANATNERVYPIGRLDRNTTGLLLLTNDGDLAQKLAHPSFGAKKIYEVELDKPVAAAHLQLIANGVELEDGVAEVDGIEYAHATKKNVVGIELHVGKNRIVRRIFESLGYNVTKLDRTLYAGLTKRDLPRGRWRMLTDREIIKLKYLK